MPTITALLRKSDELVAAALELVGQGGLESVSGLPAEMVLSLEARRTGSEARLLTHAASVLREMSCLADELVDDQAARRRPDLMVAREDRAIQTSFLAIQGRLDGGSSIYGEADAVSTTTIVGTLDAIADSPVHPDDGPSRAKQRFAALVRLCEAALSGDSGGAAARPRPRLLATFDIAGLTDDARDAGMQLLWSLAGRAPRLTHVAREELICDSTIVPVIFDGARPVQVGDATCSFSDKVRTAIIARDRRCRFCGRAPAAWCDVHHIIPGTGNTAEDGCLLCRQCHRRVHRFRWRISLRADGFIEFARRGRSFLSLPP